MVNGLTFFIRFALPVTMETGYFSASMTAYRVIIAFGIATQLVALSLLLRGQPAPFGRGMGWGLLSGSLLEIGGGVWFALTAVRHRSDPGYLDAASALDRITGFERSLLVQAGLVAAIAIVLLANQAEWMRGLMLGAAFHLAFTLSVDASAIGRERVLLQQLIGAKSHDS